MRYTAGHITHRLRRLGYFQIPAGVVVLTEPVRVPSGALLVGVGPSSVLSASGDFPAVVFEDRGGGRVSRAAFRDASVTRTNATGSPGPLAQSHGVVVWGDDVEVSGVTVSDCMYAVLVKESDVPNRRVVLRRVTARHSNPRATTSAYGLLANSVEDLVVEDCSWRDAWLDGIKLRKNCSGVRILRGDSSLNGTSTTDAGDGIDCFAGADDVEIRGTRFHGNGVGGVGGNGVVVKTVGGFNPGWGRARGVRLFGVVCSGNLGSGVAVEGVYDSGSARSPRLASAAEDDRPRACDVELHGVVCSGNANYGAFLNGERVRVVGGVFRANGLEGLRVAENATDVLVTGASVRGCGAASPGARPAVTVEPGATRVTIADVDMYGKASADGDEGPDEGRATTHRNGVEVLAGATHVTVRGCSNRHVTSDPNESPLVAFGDSAGHAVTLHASGTLTSPEGKLFGGPGSTYTTSSGGLFVKDTGAPNSRDGWAKK